MNSNMNLNMNPHIIGQLIGGNFKELYVRKKASERAKLGQIVVIDSTGDTVDIVGGNHVRWLCQVIDLGFGSQMSSQSIELISGLELEETSDYELKDAHLRNYTLLTLQNLLTINYDGKVSATKELPLLFSKVRQVKDSDLAFIKKTQNAICLGDVQGHSSIPVYLDSNNMLSHHVLIAGTTGKGKSVLMKNLIWETASQKQGMIVMDPHDEYIGRTSPGLKDHPEGVVYYTAGRVPKGGNTLKINLELLRPSHFEVIELSNAQRQVMYLYHKKFGKKWISELFTNNNIEEKSEFHEMSLAVVRRKLRLLLDITVRNNELECSSVFDSSAGSTTIKDIARHVLEGRVVIIDTSQFSGQEELLIGSMITAEVFGRYKAAKLSGELDSLPVASIVLEEAPRVLGKDVLTEGHNIFSTIAREGRKFRVGLVAITQLPSLIPREILANMNTKIILGIEMSQERNAIIESSSQDLSAYSRTIASLDKGEALISSPFLPFAVPLKIPFFDERVKRLISEDRAGRSKVESIFPELD
ncbi:ATP-binding protein [Candidatus Woesearchaeota archaeon]|nr:ATP-binding protein [Candidatus Woesearchaeota archaeon]